MHKALSCDPEAPPFDGSEFSFLCLVSKIGVHLAKIWQKVGNLGVRGTNTPPER
jgi:hypothetical protein